MLRKFKNLFHLFEAIAAAIYFGFPGKKLTVVGVTGTDGKTTTASLIQHILTQAGMKSALSSTLNSPHTTTPGRWRLQKFLVNALLRGCTHAVVEVTSIAVDQNRIWGIDFEVGVLTNIAQNEHLDYHGNFEDYRNAKIKFLKKCRKKVINADDPAARLVQATASFSLKSDFKYKTKLIGDFNKSNVLAAVTAAKLLGIDEGTISQAVTSFDSPSGRLEVVVTKPFTVIVDFAHTPQAFEKVLPVARSLLKNKTSRLIHVFGATGDRDKVKRPIMASLAAKFDDLIFLTHEDTYSENPDEILAMLEKGLREQNFKNYEVIRHREQAIEKALGKARSGDVVILTGVGHQKSMNIGGKEIPWSEQETVRTFLNGRKD